MCACRDETLGPVRPLAAPGRSWLLAGAAASALWLLPAGMLAAKDKPSLVPFTAVERAQIAALALPASGHSVPRDPSNALDGQREAIALGRWLFFNPALSADGRLACASCHVPGKAFQDGLTTATGLAQGQRATRNTPSLLDTALNRWWGWGGEHDSLWAASLAPLSAPAEMAADARHVRTLLQRHPKQQMQAQRLHQQLQAKARALQRPRDDEAEAFLVTLAKALAAYQATLRSPRTPFDDFAQALAAGDARAAASYPLAAQRGLKLFIGEGRCVLCHGGPRLSHGEFADIGIPFFLPNGEVDGGRHAGLKVLLQDRARFNRLGPYSDEPSAADGQRASAVSTRHVQAEHRHFGEFRVPSLRGVGLTAPYMHDGSLERLRYAVRHYSLLNEERLHADGERILRRLSWSEEQEDDVATFLRSLSPPLPGGMPARPRTKR
jgi:cytochrome c peroxidase